MTKTSYAVLIPISQALIGVATVPAVDARDLRKGLGIRKDFSDWIKQQLKRARLVLDRDYCKVLIPFQGQNLPLEGELSADEKHIIEYWLTIDGAKHIAMMANTERGFQVREYFLECERRANDPAALMAAEKAWQKQMADDDQKLRKVAETRRNFGRRAAQKVWIQSGLMTVPEMFLGSAQGDLPLEPGAAPAGKPN
jgi:phage anti-repressor protein